MLDMLSYFADEMVTATLTPGAAGTYTNGEWVPATGTPASISIVFPQPLDMEALQQLPEGERVKNYVQTWTKTDVDVRSGTTNGDRITYDGKTYLVYQAEDRTFPGGFKRIVMRENTYDE